MHRSVEAFLEMMVVERAAATHTVQAYARDLEDLTAYLKREGSIVEVDEGVLRRYITHLSKTGLAASSVVRRLSCLRQFFGFLCKEGIRADDPTISLDTPKSSCALPKTITEAEVSNLLSVAHKDLSAAGTRLCALLEILYATGLRVSELIALPLAAVKGEMVVLIVTGKGRKDRVVPLTDPAREAVKAYLNVRDAFLSASAPSPFLFPSRSASGHLTRQRLSQLLTELAKQAGIDPRRVSPHVLRHAFASHLLAHGADLRSVQQMLGHSDISTTQIYTHVLEERKQKLIRDKHPLARHS